MIHELRIYHCVPGRLPVLLNRFETITLAIWERFGIRQIGFWTVEIGDSNAALLAA
jgi:NIPSNAP